MIPGRNILRAFRPLLLLVLVLAPVRAEAPPVSRVSAFVEAISDVNLRTNTYYARIWVFVRTDSSAYNPNESLLILGALNSRKALHEVERENDTTFAHSIVFEATIRNGFKPSLYPFDRQRLVVHLEDAKLNIRGMRFEPRRSERGPVRTGDEIDLADWRIVGSSLNVIPHHYGAPDDAGMTYDRVEIAVDVARRNSWRLLASLLIGHLAALMVATASLFVPPSLNSSKIGLSSASLFVAIGGKIAIEAQIPPSYNAWLMDGIQVAVFLYLILILVTNIARIRVTERLKELEIKEAIRESGTDSAEKDRSSTK